MNPNFIQSISIRWDRIGRDSYLRDIPALAGTETLAFSKPVTFFVGENGSGKSTLLEALAIASGFNPEGGTKNYRFSTYDSHSELHDALLVSRNFSRPGWGYFLRAESFYNVATKEEEYADPAHPSERYHERSHGESFLAIAQKQFRPHGLYFLDEPEAALSPQRQLTLLMELHVCAACWTSRVHARRTNLLSYRKSPAALWPPDPAPGEQAHLILGHFSQYKTHSSPRCTYAAPS